MGWGSQMGDGRCSNESSPPAVEQYGAGVRRLTWVLAISATNLGLAADQLTKWWILTKVMDPPSLIPLTPFFNLTLGFNRGVSFGLLSADSPATPWLLSGLALAVLMGFSVWLARSPHPRHGVAAGLIAGGALGNVIDRLRQGAVTDFLDFHWAGYHWPAFNIADALIFVGAALLAIGSRARDATRSPTDVNIATGAVPGPGAPHISVDSFRHERTR